MMSLPKNLQSPTKNFFECRLADPLAGLNSSPAQSAKELWRW